MKGYKSLLIKMLMLSIIMLSMIMFHSCSTKRVDVSACDPDATQKTIELLNFLHKQVDKGIMIGQQDAFAYGVKWSGGREGRADFNDVTGDYPSVFGWDLGGIELDSTTNIDGVSFDDMRYYAIMAHNMGAINTYSWHGRNIYTSNSSWDVSSDKVLESILPNGKKHEEYKMWLGRLSDFLLSLKDDSGELIPVIFRPYHELTGDWFWWGESTATKEQFVAAWKMTIDFMRAKGVHNMLVSYSTASYDSTERFMARYPGNDYVDLIGTDIYHMTKDDPSGESFKSDLKKRIEIGEALADSLKKPFSIAEIGCEAIPYPDWFNTTLMPLLEGKKISYALFWRNAFNRDNHYYIPTVGHIAADDFCKFLDRDNIITLYEMNIPYKKSKAATKTQYKIPFKKSATIKDGEEFKFVVIPDRTGGERSDIFANALKMIESYKCDMVINVGDIIDGYTTDRKHAQKQWRESLESFKDFDAPLFLVPGNHDVSNSMLDSIWLSKFGAAYYHFEIGNNLFVVMNSEDTQNGYGIGERQLEQVKRVLLRSKWDRVFMFMHRPLWLDDNPNFKKIEYILSKTEHYIFAGHEHRYLYSHKDGSVRIMVATMGGGSNMRGVDVGEFDHFMIVSVSKNGARIDNIGCDGQAIPVDIVNQKNITAVNSLLSGNWVSVTPKSTSKNKVESISSQVVFTNNYTQPLTISGKVPKVDNAIFSPDKFDLIVAPNSSVKVDFKLTGREIDIDKISDVEFNFHGAYTIDNRKIELETSPKWLLDYNRVLSSDKLRIKPSSFQYIKEDWDWHGRNDGDFYFDVSIDANNLYVSVYTIDDVLIRGDSDDVMQDRIYVCASFNDKVVKLETTANKGKVVGNSFISKFKIPIGQSRQVKLNVGFMDCDNLLNTKPSILWWRPVVAHHDFGLFSRQ